MKRHMLLFGLMLAVSAIIAMLLLRKPTPSYGGKTIYQWLEETDRTRGRLELGWGITLFEFNKEPIERVTEAFQAMGTNAIPYLLAELTVEDWTIRQKVPLSGLLNEMHHPPSWLRHQRAAHAFLLLGERARPAAPELTRLTNDVRFTHYARIALTAFDQSQFDSIVNDLRSSDSKRRSLACSFLGELAYWSKLPYRPEILPALVQCAGSPRGGERDSARYAIQSLGVHAVGATQLLTEAVRTNSDPAIQLELNQLVKGISTNWGVKLREIGPGWPTNTAVEP